MTSHTGTLPLGTAESFDINDMLSASVNLSQAFTNVPTTAISDTYSGPPNDQSVFNINQAIANKDDGDLVPSQATAEALEW
ncbi:hypothetical protein PENCOP_c005G05969 [Penicillium coprophilum]|uniref:Uncharacterized protein n=1 Tax=Penicillium coprophilum TaxID=36646 RepID=A0A1V6URF7_9EURO|nr:hypothetical protein PENCOP_c005G05969 [Penicillium coprophilum]